MMFHFYLIIFSFILTTWIDFSLAQSNQTKLILLQIITRHGDRTPVDIYPNDIYKEDTWYKYGGLGQLTQIGMQQNQKYGQYLRQRYSDFLSEFYNAKQVLARSTDYDRTLMSTYSILNGLFPPKDFQIFDNSTNWQPIPVHTTLANSDTIFYDAYKCPRYQELLQDVYTSKEYLDLERENEDFLSLVQQESGFKVVNIGDLWETGDTLFVEKTHGLTIPEWAVKNYDKLIFLLNKGFYFDFRTPEMAKLSSGGVLFDMRKNILSKINGSQNILYLYGAHDTYIASLTKLLNMSDYINQPPYVSSIVMELHQSINNNSSYFIRVFLKNNTADQPIYLRPMTLDGCADYCPLNEFMDLIKDRVIADWSSACTAKQSPPIKYPFLSDFTLIMTIGTISTISLMVTIMTLVNCKRNLRGEFKHEQLL